MRLLCFIIAGLALGYFLGSLIGENRAVEDAGWLTILVEEDYRAHFGKRGALIGGVVGVIAAFASAEEKKK